MAESVRKNFSVTRPLKPTPKKKGGQGTTSLQKKFAGDVRKKVK